MSPFGGLTDNKESSGSCFCFQALRDPVDNHSGQTALPNVKGRFLIEHTAT